MRIVHVITKGDVGGAQTHVAELVAAQRAACHEVAVVAGSDGPAMRRIAADGADVRVLDSLGAARHRLRQRNALDELSDALLALRPDVVHAHSSNAGFLARLACRKLGVACVYTAHGWPFQRGAAMRQRLLSWGGELVAGRLGDAVICLTEAEARRARRSGVARRRQIWVVPNGLADVAPELRGPARRDAPAIVMVARFAPPKRQRQLVDVMARLADRAWSLTLIGDGPEIEAVTGHAERLLGDRVHVLGHRDDVPQLLADHDVIVLWSAYEGMPISLLEGMRAGLCCVASDLPGVRALFGSPPAGATAATDDELAEVLDQLLGEPTERERLGALGRRRFEEQYSVEAMERRVAAVYATVLSTRRAVRRGRRSAS